MTDLKKLEREILEALGWRLADWPDMAITPTGELWSGNPSLENQGAFFTLIDPWLDANPEVTMRFERQDGKRAKDDPYRWRCEWFVPSYQNVQYGATIAEAGIKAWHGILREMGKRATGETHAKT